MPKHAIQTCQHCKSELCEAFFPTMSETQRIRRLCFS